MSSTNFEPTSAPTANVRNVSEVAGSLPPDLKRCMTTEAPTEEQKRQLKELGLIREQQNALGATFWWFTVLGDAVRARIVLENGRLEG